ncbi:MAG: hypothetical protein ACR2IS_03350 [Nitrososphaeraceae archaeon]
MDAALYDKDNRLITMEGAGFADVSTPPPGDNSAFSITLGGEEHVDHYTYNERREVVILSFSLP